MSSFGLQPKCLCPSGYKGLHCEGCSFVAVRTLLYIRLFTVAHVVQGSAIAAGTLPG